MAVTVQNQLASISFESLVENPFQCLLQLLKAAYILLAHGSILNFKPETLGKSF